MTQQVADEVLGKIARQQNDLFRRVREGTLSPGFVSLGLQDLIEGRFANNGVSYVVNVNYDLSLKKAVKAGKYDWTDSNISSKNFPSKRKGAADVEVIFVHFDRDITSNEIIRELDSQGLRPVELPELLAFGAKFPEIQRKFPVVALGSVWQRPSGSCHCAFLDVGSADKRGLFLRRFDDEWSRRCRFAVVRK